jgi:hypothetical protein
VDKTITGLEWVQGALSWTRLHAFLRSAMPHTRLNAAAMCAGDTWATSHVTRDGSEAQCLVGAAMPLSPPLGLNTQVDVSSTVVLRQLAGSVQVTRNVVMTT